MVLMVCAKRQADKRPVSGLARLDKMRTYVGDSASDREGLTSRGVAVSSGLNHWMRTYVVLDGVGRNPEALFKGETEYLVRLNAAYVCILTSKSCTWRQSVIAQVGGDQARQ